MHNDFQDETGASAILAEQLDAAMGGKPKEFREVQGSESPEFLQVWNPLGTPFYPFTKGLYIGCTLSPLPCLQHCF